MLTSFPVRAHKRERGVVLVMASAAIITLLAFTGMAVDVGYLQYMRIRVQDAADGAVQAALIELENGNSDWQTAGLASATLNGFAAGTTSGATTAAGVTVTLNSPPLQGTFLGKANAVEAIVTVKEPTFFMQMLNFGSVNLSSYSAGSFTVTGTKSEAGTGSTAGCVYVLDSTDAQTLDVQGTSPTFNCGVVVESSSSSAVYLSGSDLVTIGTGYTLGVVGPSTCTASSPAISSNCGIDYTSGGDYVCSTGSSTCSGKAVPTANGISNPGDPFTNVPVPTFPTSAPLNNPTYGQNFLTPTNNTIQPGNFCNGLTIGNTNGATYTFAAGVYVIAGGTLTINQPGTVTGSGVTFYLTSPADLTTQTGKTCSSNATSTTIAKVNLQGSQTKITLSAPASGASSGIPGMLFFENRSSTTDNAPQISGNSTTSFNGGLYFKNSTLTFTGVNISSTGYMMIVVKKLSLNGSSPIIVYNVNDPVLGTTVLTGTAAVIGQ